MMYHHLLDIKLNLKENFIKPKTKDLKPPFPYLIYLIY